MKDKIITFFKSIGYKVNYLLTIKQIVDNPEYEYAVILNKQIYLDDASYNKLGQFQKENST